jgi:hypothetical protein
MTGLGDSVVGYAVLIILLIAMTVVALMRLIAILKMLKQYHTRGQHGEQYYPPCGT